MARREKGAGEANRYLNATAAAGDGPRILSIASSSTETFRSSSNASALRTRFFERGSTATEGDRPLDMLPSEGAYLLLPLSLARTAD
jgi:hypothetical protein